MATRLSKEKQALSNGPTKGQFLAAMRDVALRDAEIATKNGSRRRALRRYKAEGIDTDALLATLRKRHQDPDVLREKLAKEQQYCDWAGLPLFKSAVDAGAAVDPFSDLTDIERAEHLRWEADQAGHATGRAGGDRFANKHMAGTETYVAWDNGYLRGQAEIAEEMGPDWKKKEAKANKRAGGEAGPKGRGRKAQQSDADDSEASGESVH